MQPGAIRVRAHRERRRQALTDALPVTPPAAPAAPAAALPVTPFPVDERVTASLRETQVVTGPGADAFAAVAMDDGNGNGDATPLLEAEPPPPPVQTSPEEAAMIGKLVGMYAGFGWGLMAQKHTDKLAALADSVLAKVHPELAALPPEQKVALGLGALVEVVEQSATRIALKRNIRIPYQDEGIVGIAIASSTFGIVNEFKSPAPRNDNRTAAPVTAQAPRPSSPRVTREQAAAAVDVDGLDERPSARATQAAADAELVL